MKHFLSALLALLIALGGAVPAQASGESLIVTAPWSVSRGDLVITGGITGIASGPASNGVPVRIWREGVFTVAKVTGTAWTTGDALYFAHGDAGLSKVSASKTFFGFAVASASSGATTGAIVLVPSGPITTIGDALTTLTATVTGFATALTTGTLTASSISSHSVDGVDVHVLASSVTTNTSDISSHGSRLSALEAVKSCSIVYSAESTATTSGTSAAYVWELDLGALLSANGDSVVWDGTVKRAANSNSVTLDLDHKNQERFFTSAETTSLGSWRWTVTVRRVSSGIIKIDRQVTFNGSVRSSDEPAMLDNTWGPTNRVLAIRLTTGTQAGDATVGHNRVIYCPAVP